MPGPVLETDLPLEDLDMSETSSEDFSGETCENCETVILALFDSLFYSRRASKPISGSFDCLMVLSV